MPNTNTVIAKHVSDEAVETLLFINHAGDYAVRVYDLDASELVGIVTFPSRDAAEAYYAKAVRS